MNSIWNKNLTLFIQRFPALAKMFSLNSVSDIPQDLPDHLKAPLELLPSKQGLPTAKDEGKFLHSAYNPLREGEASARAVKSSLKDCWGAAFFSFGLGYSLISYAELFPQDTLIIVENDIRYFFTALSLLDWTPVFKVQKCILALGAGLDSVVALLEEAGGFNHIALSESPAQTGHSSDYFQALHSLIERNKRKAQINASTLEKFSSLWLKNTCRNISFLNELQGINIFKDSCPQELPAFILAAGPSLEEALPHLAKIKERALLIAVDTALRACLRAGVEADFILLTDPQYYAWRHIAGLSSPSSILITESAAYPSVFRFKCKKIIMCASLFPLGQYIESAIGSKGTLVAGGSVSTTAWEFARFIGAKEIYFSGLDLGYPSFQTHIKGSTFEENIHTKSKRLSPAEKSASSLLFAAGISKEKDYGGREILTDSKMKMFAWWFESKAEEFKNDIKTFSLSDKSLKIPGFYLSSLADFLSQRPKADLKKEFFLSGEENSQKEEQLKEKQTQIFNSALENLNSGLEELYQTAKKAFRSAEEGIKSQNPQKYLALMEEADRFILGSKYKEIASLVFPTESQLSRLMEELPPMNNEIKSSLQKSRLIYKELMNSISRYKNFLK
ncbi:MAG: DUF115 domain-containing protein [Treponema sp.]|nr:DUF115 domain-containing protein [Treponema sp.]